MRDEIVKMRQVLMDRKSEEFSALNISLEGSSLSQPKTTSATYMTMVTFIMTSDPTTNQTEIVQ